MVSCALRSCGSRSECNSRETTGITFHSFPRDPVRRQAWMQFVARGRWQPTKYSRLCSKHFSNEHIDRTSKSSVRLRSEAIPTIKEEIDGCPYSTGLILSRSSKTSVKLDNQNETGGADNDDSCPSSSNDVQQEDPDDRETENITIKVEEFIKTCRLCMKEVTDDVKNIFEDYLDDQVPIYLGIAVCIYPIEVSIDDPLTKYACNECLETLASFLKFRNFVIRNDKIQRESIGQTVPLTNEERSSPKRVMDADNELDMVKKKRKTDILLTPEFFAPQSLAQTQEDSIATVRSFRTERPDENQEEHSNTISIEYKEEPTEDDPNIIIIKEEEVEEEEHIDSNLGFPLQVINSSPTADGNVFFCMVDGYLMEHKFSKENIRHFKCALSKCPAIGMQELAMPGSLKNAVNIIKPHNHQQPTAIDIKKQKIISVIRRKLQVAKGCTITSLYEEVSKLDSGIAELLPMNVLMAEICDL